MKGLAAILILAGMSVFIFAAAQSKPVQTVGEFSTSLAGRDRDQRHNAILSLRKLRGEVILPRKSFSFNQVIGSWSRDQGYRRAPVSFNGTLIDAWGGGVCQTSTTLYNAALVAGLEIESRSSHRFAPDYVLPGRDAAVAYPNIDLTFRNPYDVPLKIEGEILGDRLIIRLVGEVKPPKVNISQRRISQSQPKLLEYGAGRHARIRSPGKPGWEVETRREINGQTEVLSHDVYPVMHRVVERAAGVK